MALLEENVQNQVKEIFKTLQNPIKLIVFTQEDDRSTSGDRCKTCHDNRLLMEEVASLSDTIAIEVYDLTKDKEKAAQYNVDKVPATIVEGSRDHGIRIYGMPGGYEFATLLETIKMVSTGDSGLSDDTKNKIRSLTNNVHIQVFVTLM
jgi:glutaredoxin-like protein